MSFSAIPLTGSKPDQYAQLLAQARGLLHGERDRIANAANLSALVYHALPQLNWVGFYFYDGSELVVGPFQGLRGQPFDRISKDGPDGGGFRFH